MVKSKNSKSSLIKAHNFLYAALRKWRERNWSVSDNLNVPGIGEARVSWYLIFNKIECYKADIENPGLGILWCLLVDFANELNVHRLVLTCGDILYLVDSFVHQGFQGDSLCEHVKVVQILQVLLCISIWQMDLVKPLDEEAKAARIVFRQIHFEFEAFALRGKCLVKELGASGDQFVVDDEFLSFFANENRGHPTPELSNKTCQLLLIPGRVLITDSTSLTGSKRSKLRWHHFRNWVGIGGRGIEWLEDAWNGWFTKLARRSCATPAMQTMFILLVELVENLSSNKKLPVRHPSWLAGFNYSMINSGQESSALLLNEKVRSVQKCSFAESTFEGGESLNRWMKETEDAKFL